MRSRGTALAEASGFVRWASERIGATQGVSFMRRFIQWIAGIVGVLVLAVVALYAVAYFRSEQAMARTFTVSDAPLILNRDAQTLARGQHIFATRGCGDCHGASGEGKLLFDAGPVAKVVPPNITVGGRLKSMSPDQVAAAIRHGVAASGRPLVFMPSEDFHEMSDEDTAALVAYMQSLPPSQNDPGPLEVRPLGRVLWLFGKFPLLPAEKLDHSPRTRAAPAVAANAEYGKYLAQGCTGCHGANFAGQHVPGTPPEFPDSRNLTPTGIGGWQQSDFFRAIREGKRPDCSAIDPFMPWQTYAKMSDVELSALWAYLKTLPPAGARKKG
jgi:mono/diheme cytochrome c family protein